MSEVKLNREIYNVVVLDNEWMCNEHPDTQLEFHHLSSQYEYYACPKCGQLMNFNYCIFYYYEVYSCIDKECNGVLKAIVNNDFY